MNKNRATNKAILIGATAMLIVLIMVTGPVSANEVNDNPPAFLSSLVEPYDVTAPEMFYVDGMPRGFMGKTACGKDAKTGEQVCRIAIRQCMADMDQLEEVLAHEAAHFVDHKVNGKLSHSHSWKKIMREMGYSKHAKSHYKHTRGNKKSKWVGCN